VVTVFVLKKKIYATVLKIVKHHNTRVLPPFATNTNQIKTNFASILALGKEAELESYAGFFELDEEGDRANRSRI